MWHDEISQLPDSLITEILSYLRTKESVKTSVLSTRWRNLWVDVPVLDLHSNDFNNFSEVAIKNFGNRFFKSNRESRLQKFKIKFDKSLADLVPISGWLTSALGHRGFQHLSVEVQNPMSFTGFIPVNMYTSKTLVTLKLQHVGLKTPTFAVSLPCLKVMHLEHVFYLKDGPLIMEKLISGCPVLEDLYVVRYQYDFLKTLRVTSRSLKIFRLTFPPGVDSIDYAVEVDAPGLEYMSFGDRQSDGILVKNLNALLKIDIDTDFNVKPHGQGSLEPNVLSKRDLIREFLTGIASVTHMIISQLTLEILNGYSKLETIPEFHNLTHLQAAFSISSSPLLPVFLESCSNLQTLILDFSVSGERGEMIDLTYVPVCLSSTLECVEIKKLIMGEENGIKLVNYFLENSGVLKKLYLSVRRSPHSHRTTDQEMDFYKSRLALSTKRSPRCQVYFAFSESSDNT